MRLIDADALVKDLCENYIFTGFTELLHDIASAINAQPTMDAVPVRHGKWIHRGCGVFTCDKCSRDIGLNVYTTEKASERFKYCPNCGARMDADETD